MKIKMLASIFILISTSLFSTSNLTPYKDAASRDSLIVTSLTKIVAEKLFLKENLRLVGSGGQMMNEIEKLIMKFDYGQEIDLNKARQLIIIAIQSYLEEINQSKEIRRYLKNYPFTPNNIEVGIYVHKPDGSKVPKNKLFYISAIDSIIYYYLDNPKFYSRIILHQETYDEALKILNESQ